MEKEFDQMCKFSEPLNDQVPVYPPWTLWEGEVLRAEGAADRVLAGVGT